MWNIASANARTASRLAHSRTRGTGNVRSVGTGGIWEQPDNQGERAECFDGSGTIEEIASDLADAPT
jgi:hypothetical protein